MRRIATNIAVHYTEAFRVLGRDWAALREGAWAIGGSATLRGSHAPLAWAKRRAQRTIALPVLARPAFGALRVCATARSGDALLATLLLILLTFLLLAFGVGLTEPQQAERTTDQGQQRLPPVARCRQSASHQIKAVSFHTSPPQPLCATNTAVGTGNSHRDNYCAPPGQHRKAGDPLAKQIGHGHLRLRCALRRTLEMRRRGVPQTPGAIICGTIAIEARTEYGDLYGFGQGVNWSAVRRLGRELPGGRLRCVSNRDV